MTFFMREEDSFSYAFNQYADTVYRVAIHNTGNPADAEDVSQEVFLKLLNSSKSFKDNEHLKAWLIRVTINLCHDRQRKIKQEILVNQPVSDEPVSDENAVLEAVKALPENYRNTIYLHYYEGYTAKEIGKILGAKEGTVLSWLSRARAQLRKDFTGGFDDE